jgi:hypothetical protein
MPADPIPVVANARAEALAAMRHGAKVARDCEWYGEDEVLPNALDAIPPAVLARLAVERGGMEQVGWGGCLRDGAGICTEEDGHEWWLVFEDGTNDLDPEHPKWPVYRLSEEAPDAG